MGCIQANTVFLFILVYSQSKAGVLAMTEDLDFSEELEKAPELIREIFQKQTLGVPDESKLTIEQNTKAFKLWVIQFFFDCHFKNHFGFSKVKQTELYIHTCIL